MADVPQLPTDVKESTPVKPPVVPQVRTFAKDAAAITGKPVPKDVVNVPAPPPPTPVKPVQVVKPPEPARIIPKAPTTDESREAVLARLRARTAAATPKPAPPPPPSEPAALTRQELLTRMRERAASKPYIAIDPLPARAPIPKPFTPPEPPPGIPVVSKEPVVPLHTYKSDFAEYAKQQGASPLSVLSAEQDAYRAKAPQMFKDKKKPLIMVGIGVALVLAGVGGVYLAYTFVMKPPPAANEPIVAALIFANEHARIEGTGPVLQSALSALSSRPLTEGGVVVAYIAQATTSPEGKPIEAVASGGALIKALALKAPEILLRNAQEASTVGVIKSGAETRPFFILRVASYERTFAGLLSWEATMQNDLSVFYPLYPAPVAATTTASSTPVAPSFAQPLAFEDATVANHDARILRDTLGNTLLLYGYKDKQTLVIARDEGAFTELLKRLSATRAQ